MKAAKKNRKSGSCGTGMEKNSGVSTRIGIPNAWHLISFFINSLNKRTESTLLSWIMSYFEYSIVQRMRLMDKVLCCCPTSGRNLTVVCCDVSGGEISIGTQWGNDFDWQIRQPGSAFVSFCYSPLKVGCNIYSGEKSKGMLKKKFNGFLVL